MYVGKGCGWWFGHNMSLCTLPSAVSAPLLTVSPVASIALFINGFHLNLCRKSGQQVWNSRLPTRSPIVSVSWSPDGELFALMHEDATISLCSVANGRPLNVSMDCNGAACIAWSDPSLFKRNYSASGANKSNIWTALSKFGALNDGFKAAPLAAVGTVEGKLRICLYGALNIGDVPVFSSSAPIQYVLADESRGEYVTIQNALLSKVQTGLHHDAGSGNSSESESQQILSILGLDSHNLTSELARQKIQRMALAIRLVSTLVQGCTQLTGSLEAIQSLNKSFVAGIGLEGLHALLVRAIVYGTTSRESAEWINTQHEQGFKIWYRAFSQHWDSVKTTLSTQIISSIEQILVIFGSLGIDMTYATKLHETALDSLKTVALHYESFELQAMFLESVFTNEIDRPIAVTVMDADDVENVAQSLFSCGTLGILEASLGSRLLDYATSIKQLLGDNVETSRKQLCSKLEVVYTIDLGSEVVQIKKLGTDFAVILKSNKLVIIDSDDGKITSSIDIIGSNPCFTGVGADVLSIDEGNYLVHSNGQRVELEFEPSAVATRVDSATNKVVACVLSRDCQHYQFVEIDG